MDGTAPPDYDAIFGHRVGSRQRNILSADHRERNSRAKQLVRSVAAILGLPRGTTWRALELVDRARDGSPRERAVAALYAARVAPVGALVEALIEAGLMGDRDGFYPYRTAYECGLSPAPPTPEDAANVYSVHRLPRTSWRLEASGLLEAVDRFVRSSIASTRPRPGGSYRAIAVRALREIDRQVPGLIDWEEVERLW